MGGLAWGYSPPKMKIWEGSAPPTSSEHRLDRLNNCLLLDCHTLITDTMDTVKIAKRFSCANEPRKGHFGKFE